MCDEMVLSRHFKKPDDPILQSISSSLILAANEGLIKLKCKLCNEEPYASFWQKFWAEIVKYATEHDLWAIYALFYKWIKEAHKR